MARKTLTSARLHMEPVDGLLLKVDDLHVEFRTRDGVAKAINGTSFTLSERETSPFSVNQGRVNRSLRKQLWASSSPLQPDHWRAD